MEAYAVIETGGKQYRVSVGSIVEIEKIPGEENAEVAFDRVLALSDGTALSIGTPVVAGAAVKGKVLGQILGKKVVSFKKKRRKGYEKTIGHRQELTKVEIISL